MVLALVGGCILLLVGGGCVILAWVIQGAFQKNTVQVGAVDDNVGSDDSVASSRSRADAPQDKWAEVREAYSGKGDVGVDADTLRDIRQCLDDIVQAMTRGDSEAFANLLDIRRMIEQVRRTGIIRSPDKLTESFLDTEVRKDLDTPWVAARYRIARINLLNDGDEAIVYGTFWTEDERAAEMRWWLRRNNRLWQAFDWEVISVRMRNSVFNATIVEYLDSFGMSEYERCWDELDLADERMMEGDYEGAATHLQRAQAARVVGALADQTSVLITLGWLEIDRNEEAIACAELVKLPDETPEAYLVQAYAYEAMDDHERALEFARLYARQMGDCPTACLQIATSLEAISRHGEAAVYWQKLLRHDPGNETAQEGLASTLRQLDAEELKATLRKFDDPSSAAGNMVVDLYYYGKIAELESIVEVLDERTADSPSQHFAKALLHTLREEYEPAARSYREAWSSEPVQERQQEYMRYYLSMMLEAGQPMEGYVSVPDPVLAFEYLAEDYWNERDRLPRTDFEEILALHRRHHPDDPWGDLSYGSLLLDDEKYAEAEQVLSAAMQNVRGEDVLSELFRPRHVESLVRVGRAIDHYRAASDQDDCFLELARLCDGFHRHDELAQLVKIHRANNPFDFWVDYYDAQLCVARGDYEAADRFFANGLRAAADEAIAYDYRWSWILARVDAGRALSAYHDIPPAEGTFAILASMLQRRNEWTLMKELLALHAARHAQSESLFRWQIEYHWQTGEYDDVTKLLDPWPDQRVGGLGKWEREGLGGKLVRSYLRLGQLEDARRAAERLTQLGGDAYTLAIVHAARRDRAALRQVINEYNLVGQCGSLYYDEDCRDVLRSPEFRSFRDEYPPRLPLWPQLADVGLLLDRKAELTAEKVGEAARQALGNDVEVTVVEPLATAGAEKCYLVHSEPHKLVITTLVRRYDSDIEEFAGSPLESAYRNHVAAISVELLPAGVPKFRASTGAEPLLTSLPPAEHELPSRAVCRVAAKLADESCLAYFISGSLQRLVPNDERTRAALLGPSPASKLHKLGEARSLSVNIYEDHEDRVAARERRQRFDGFLDAFQHRRPEQEFFFRVSLGEGITRELQWLRLKSVGQSMPYFTKLVGTMTTDSKLLDWLVRGEPLSVDGYDVIDWKYTDGDTVRRGGPDR